MSFHCKSSQTVGHYQTVGHSKTEVGTYTYLLGIKNFLNVLFEKRDFSGEYFITFSFEKATLPIPLNGQIF